MSIQNNKLPPVPEEIILTDSVRSNHEATVHVDATKLSALLKCEKSFQYKHQEVISSKEKADALSFGIAAHEVLDVWNRRPQVGTASDSLLSEQLGEIVAYSLAVAADNELQLCKDKRRQPESLLHLITGYAETYRNPTDTTDYYTAELSDGTPCAELHFAIPSPYDKTVVFTGYIDRIIENSLKQRYVLDYKSTVTALGSWWADGFQSGPQMNLYQWAGSQLLGEKLSGVMVHGMQMLTTGTRFSHQPVMNSHRLADEMIREYTTIVQRYRKQGESLRNRAGCTSPFKCEFFDLCMSVGKTRNIVKKNNFQPAELWSPETKREPGAQWVSENQLNW